MKKLKLLIISILILCISLSNIQVLFANDYGDGSNNTVVGGYGHSIYMYTSDGTPVLKDFGTGVKYGNIEVSSAFMNDWGNYAFFNYLYNPGRENMYIYRQHSGGGGDVRVTDEYTFPSVTTTYDNGSGHREIPISQWPDDYGYGMQFDVYDDGGDTITMGEFKLMYNDTWYTLQQCIDLGYIEPMVLIAASGSTNLEGFLTGGYHVINRWPSDMWMCRASIMWFTKKGHIPQKIHVKGYSENNIFRAWSAKDMSIAVSPVDLYYEDITRSVVYSNSSSTIYCEEAEDGSGNYEYSIKSQQNSSNSTVSYFTMSGKDIIAAARTPVDTYKVDVTVHDITNNAYKTATVTVNVNAADITVRAPDQVYKYDGNPHGEPITATTIDGSTPTIKYGYAEGNYSQTTAPKITNIEDSKLIYYEVTAPNHKTKRGSYNLKIVDKLITIEGIECDGYNKLVITDDYSGVNSWYFTYRYNLEGSSEELNDSSEIFSASRAYVKVGVPMNRTVVGLSLYAKDNASNETDDLLAGKNCRLYPVLFNIDYNSNGHGTAPESQTKNWGETINLRQFISNEIIDGGSSTIAFNSQGGSFTPGSSTLVEKITYSQTDWAKDSISGSKYGSEAEYSDNDDVTFYALWSENSDWQSIAMPAAVSKTGYNFKDWNTSSDGDGSAYTATQVYDPDTYTELQTSRILYANWEEKSYTVTFDGNGADSGSQEDQTRKYTEELTLPTTTNFTKDGYVFIGWFDAASGGNRLTSIHANTDEDSTVYAQWFSLVTDFTYKGYTESYTAPIDGLYKFEVWGAQGGTVYFGGGKGGYSMGYKYLTAGTTVYVCVGGAGNNGGSGGYNGGGRAQNNSNTSYGSGGGATHMATADGQLRSLASNVTSVLIVAGGGGGDGSYNGGYKGGSGGSGGGTNGGGGSTGGSTGGTQTSGGYHTDSSNAKWRGGFGYGGAAGDRNTSGGGGGWYGGGACESHGCPAGGGSGYIGGVPSTTYKDTTYSPSTSNGQQSGNGKARITLYSW